MPRARRPTAGQASCSGADGLKKSNSFEPLASKNTDSSEEEETTSPRGNKRELTLKDVRMLGDRLKSASMSPIKQRSRAKEAPEDGESDAPGSEKSEVAYLKPEGQDDVFTNRLLGDSSPEEDDKEQTTSEPPEAVHIDAQGMYPPSACIFVANLTKSVSDEKLEAAVTEIFSHFGTVFVKIRRDRSNMPYAFCQFTCDEDAERAAEADSDKNFTMFGRTCRTEKAKANSVFIVYKKSGGEITEDEAYNLLYPFGSIARVEQMSEETRQELNLPPAMVVHYNLYDARRDIYTSMKSQPYFMVVPYDFKKKGCPPGYAKRRGPDGKDQYVQYTIDRRSAYFGNLPLDMTEEELRELAISCGQVRGITLNRKFVANGSTEICFAFVEYVRPDSVDDAVRAFNGKQIRDREIRVQRKESRCFQTPPRAPPAHAPPSSAGHPSVTPGTMYSPARAPFMNSGRSSSRPVPTITPPAGRPGYGTTQAPASHWSRSSRASSRGNFLPSSGFGTPSRQPVNGPGFATPDWSMHGRRSHMPRQSIQGFFNTSGRSQAQNEAPNAAARDTSSQEKGKEPVRPTSVQMVPEVNTSEDSTMPPKKAESDLDSKPKDHAEYEHNDVQQTAKDQNTKSDTKSESKEATPHTDNEDQGRSQRPSASNHRHNASYHRAFHRHRASSHRRSSPNTSAYSMPYMPPQMPSYGYSAVPYAIQGPYTPNMHSTIMNGYYGLGTGFMWTDPYTCAMYAAGLLPGMSAPPPTGPLPPLPTSSRAAASRQQERNEEENESKSTGEKDKPAKKEDSA